jgi:hypothetical protein
MRMLLRKLSVEMFACLFGLLGALVGPLVGLNGYQSHVQSLQSIDPDIVQCGLAVVFPILSGICIGGFVGCICGMILYSLMVRGGKS